MKSKPLKVVYIPTTGALKLGYWTKGGKLIPFWFIWPVFKGILNWYVKKRKMKLLYAEVLKLETIARLNVAIKLYRKGSVNTFFLCGGKSTRKPDSVEMMRNYLMLFGVKSDQIICDRSTLQTSDKITTFVAWCKEISKSEKYYVDYVIDTTSHYNFFRSLYHLKLLAPTCLERHFSFKPTFPPMSWLCLKYEYLYNLAAEPAKVFCMFPPQVQIWWRKREENLRGIR
jgi:hypothetical protein